MRNLDGLAEDCAELDYVTGEPRRAPDLEVALCANLGVGGHNVGIVLEKV
jgi:3-oxoacyl-[acyl-carrier-protein] synthase II